VSGLWVQDGHGHRWGAMEGGAAVGARQSSGGTVGDAEGEPESGRHWYSDLSDVQVRWYAERCLHAMFAQWARRKVDDYFLNGR
jgi:hypothetical protein